MNTMLIIIMLIMAPDGTVSKQTTETKVKSEQYCLQIQLNINNTQYPDNVRLLSVTCDTTGEI